MTQTRRLSLSVSFLAALLVFCPPKISTGEKTSSRGLVSGNAETKASLNAAASLPLFLTEKKSARGLSRSNLSSILPTAVSDTDSVAVGNRGEADSTAMPTSPPGMDDRDQRATPFQAEDDTSDEGGSSSSSGGDGDSEPAMSDDQGQPQGETSSRRAAPESTPSAEASSEEDSSEEASNARTERDLQELRDRREELRRRREQMRNQRRSQEMPEAQVPDAQEAPSEGDPLPGAVPDRYDRTSPMYAKVKDAASEYRSSGNARIVRASDREEVYPYGKQIPIVETPVLHFSTVTLAENEYVTNMSIGDQNRWSVTTGSMGQKGDFQQMVYIKPQECGPNRTNLLLATNQNRTYELILKSIPCNISQGERPDLERWTRRVSYYYPDGRSIGPSNIKQSVSPPSLRGAPPAQGQNMRGPSRRMRRPAPQNGSPRMQRPPAGRGMQSDSSAGMQGGPAPRMRGGPASQMQRVPSPTASRGNPAQAGRSSRFKSDRGGSSMLDLRSLATSNYEVDRERGFPCKLQTVGDDGERTYIRLSDTPGCQSTFPLYQLQERGQLQMTNYNIFNGQTYVVEGVHDDLALLFRNQEGEERRAVIENTSIKNRRR